MRSVVYFLQARCGAITIGKSGNFPVRFRALCASNPRPLKQMGVIPCANASEALLYERNLHERFATARIHREWFEGTPDLVRFIEEHAVAFHVELPPDIRTRPFARPEEVAAHFGLTATEVRRRAHAGELPALLVGSQWRFDLDEVADVLGVAT